VLFSQRISSRAIAMLLVGIIVAVVAAVPAWCVATGMWW
jgi:hypothetical protein